MKMRVNRKAAFVAAGLLLTGAVLGQGIGELIKVVGVAAAVHQFAPQINRAINGLTQHHDTDLEYTKVVPIVTAGINSRKAVGAAQVMGPKSKVDKVQAVAQLEQDILGNEVRIRAMIPISTQNVISDIKKVDGVSVTGIVDLKVKI